MALATGVFLKALHQRANFYAACVYLSQSSANLMVSERVFPSPDGVGVNSSSLMVLSRY